MQVPGDAPSDSADQASGRVQIQLPPITAAATGIRNQGQGDRVSASKALKAKAHSAACLPRRLIAPRSLHRRICGPKCGWSSSLASSLGLDRAKQKAADEEERERLKADAAKREEQMEEKWETLGVDVPERKKQREERLGKRASHANS